VGTDIKARLTCRYVLEDKGNLCRFDAPSISPGAVKEAEFSAEP
jgi:hypothetical protein